jgi:hypothetical protein
MWSSVFTELREVAWLAALVLVLSAISVAFAAALATSI